MNSIENKLEEILSITLGKKITPSAAKIGNPVEWDSLKQIEIMMLVEEEFSIGIQPDDIAEATSFQLICDLVKNRSGR